MPFDAARAYHAPSFEKGSAFNCADCLAPWLACVRHPDIETEAQVAAGRHLPHDGELIGRRRPDVEIGRAQLVRRCRWGHDGLQETAENERNVDHGLAAACAGTFGSVSMAMSYCFR